MLSLHTHTHTHIHARLTYNMYIYIWYIIKIYKIKHCSIGVTYVSLNSIFSVFLPLLFSHCSGHPLYIIYIKIKILLCHSFPIWVLFILNFQSQFVGRHRVLGCVVYGLGNIQNRQSFKRTLSFVWFIFCSIYLLERKLCDSVKVNDRKKEKEERELWLFIRILYYR